MKSIAVYCGSSTGKNPIYTKLAEKLGVYMAENKITVVYGAGNVGLMGVLANAALAKGGEVVGVIPQFLMEWEVGHTGITELIVTENMHQRKHILVDRSEGFIVMPGGFGTMEEFFEVLTWKQLHLHQKPIGILNVNGYYDHLIALAQNMNQEQFVKSQNLDLFVVADNVEELIEKMNETTTTPTGKWV